MKKFDGGYFLVLLLYVDDILIVGRNHVKIRMLKKALSRSFSMKDMGSARQILGIHIVAITREVRDKCALEVQHRKHETAQFDTTD